MRQSRQERAASRREYLLDQLGGCCCVCGATVGLQFDLIVSDGGRHHGLSYPDRMLEYLRQHLAENLQLMCGPCHRIKTLRDVRQRRSEALSSKSGIAIQRRNAE